VNIDFPLPKEIVGSEKRLNAPNMFKLPEFCLARNEPEFLIGKNIRLRHLLAQPEDYVDQVITVCGWARKARLAVKDTIVFIDLVDGSNSQPLQVVVENTVKAWEEVKKAKIGYSFRLTGKLEKSLGKGQSV
jgi:hypothetical protein